MTKTITLELNEEGRAQLPWPGRRGIEISAQGIHTPRGLVRTLEIPEMLYKAGIEEQYEQAPIMDFTPETPAQVHTQPSSHAKLEKRPFYYRIPRKPGETYDQLWAFLDSINGLKYNTRQDHRRTLSTLLEYCEQHNINRWSEVTEKTLQDFLGDRKPKRRERILASVRKFYRYLIKTGVETENPAENLE